ncbi:MAG: hypothetical protein JRI68_29095 [Deltaproteobacteria bacterium]|nr:hypothetical protein [Deltaproteobacteria bacterium]
MSALVGRTALSSGTGGQGGTTGGGGSADMVSYCNTVIPPFCEALFACCADQDELDAYGGTVSQCATQLNASCLAKGASAGIETLLDSGDTVLNSGELSDCAANLQALSTDCSQPPKREQLRDRRRRPVLARVPRRSLSRRHLHPLPG